MPTEHFTVSLLWSPSANFGLGLVYRKGPEFTTVFEMFYDSNIDGGYDDIYSAQNTLKTPDVYGIGASFHLPFGLTATADVNYVGYLDILKDFCFYDGTEQTYQGPAVSISLNLLSIFQA